MARFRATIQGSRGPASRLGHKAITTDTNGWNVGVNVFGFDVDGKDAFAISTNGGSNGHTGQRTIGHIVEGGQFEPTDYLIEQILSKAVACVSYGKIFMAEKMADQKCHPCYVNGR